jgi:cell division protein FtsB
MAIFSVSTKSFLKRGVLVLGLYSLSAAAVGYFIHHAHHGERGLSTKQDLLDQIALLQQEYDELKDTKSTWARKLSMLHDDGIEKDLLDERTRATLGRVHKSDVVVLIRP